MKLAHGTTYNRFMSMINDGYIGSLETIWNVSDEEVVYMWSQQKIWEGENDSDTEEIEHSFNTLINYALGSAEVGFSKEKDNLKRVVLIIDQDALEEYGRKVDIEIEQDYSCGDNTMYYAVQFEHTIPLELVEKVYIDEQPLDMWLLYFIGATHSINVNNLEHTNRSQRMIQCEMCFYEEEILEGALALFNNMNMWWIENKYFVEDLKEYTLSLKEVHTQKIVV